MFKENFVACGFYEFLVAPMFDTLEEKLLKMLHLGSVSVEKKRNLQYLYVLTLFGCSTFLRLKA